MDPIQAHVDPIPGLERAVVEDDIRRSNIKHNRLPNDADIQPIENRHKGFLSRLINKYEVGGIFGVHIPHKHFDLVSDTYMVGRHETRYGRHFYWTRSTGNDALDPGNLCGHIFTYDPDEGFCPYEFHKGLLPDLSGVDRAFFTEIGSYITKHDLGHSVALEYLIPELRGKLMSEIVDRRQQQTLQVEQEIVEQGLEEPVVTGWRQFESEVAFGPGTQYIYRPDGTHTTFNPDEQQFGING
ncbi:hypothetical protein FALBO_3358 [Fusarium albosuccineum]|uniref:Uncharacterized protein n=1 Tax=Fusarium albosuccineum TaxID=1237068 RepID=A0A8H4LKB6_9HYPO|nr:hypothetical protein FALBO_3358 [Fusarium albosuccineum]